MTTPLRAPETIVKKELDLHEVARKNIGRQRGEKYLELLLAGNTKELASFRRHHLSSTHDLRNYGSMETEFNQTVGESLARDYAGMFDEMNMGNTLY